jgi:integrase
VERNLSASIVIRGQGDAVYYEAKWRYHGRQVKRRIGPAWLERDDEGRWRARRGRVPDGAYDERRAHVAAAQLVSDYLAEAADVERIEQERRNRGVSFREVAHAYLIWLKDVKGAKPSTMADYRYLLAEPGVPAKRGSGESAGYIMDSLGDITASKITVRDVEALLAKVSKAGGSARNVNKQRAVVSAIFNYGIKESAFGLPSNPAALTDKRKEAQPGPLMFYSPAEVERLAQALSDGKHHEDPDRTSVQIAEDARDAELVRVAAYAGLRVGELLALRWGDVDFAGSAITVARAISLGVESSPKSGRVRRVPLPAQAAAAFERLHQRDDYTAQRDRVFGNAFGRTLDGSALRKRFKRARDAAKLRPLRFHDLRHTYGSLLAAAGIDLVSIQSVMGHSALSTTSRYLHARPVSEQAEAFTRAFELQASPDESKALSTT